MKANQFNKYSRLEAGVSEVRTLQDHLYKQQQ